MGKIGDRLQVHAASVTNTIQRLEASGFVERIKHPADGRGTLARLLPAGAAMVGRGARALEAIDYGLEGLRESRRSGLFDALIEFRQANRDFD